jgi:hypothetical protein
MANPWTTSIDNHDSEVHEQTLGIRSAAPLGIRSDAPTLPHFLSHGKDHYSTNMKIDVIWSFLFLLKTLGFYVIQTESGWAFEIQSFPNDDQVIIKVDIYGNNKPAGFILDFFNLKGTNNMYRKQLETIWNFFKEKEMWNYNEVFLKEDPHYTLSRSRKEWFGPNTKVGQSKLECCLEILQNGGSDKIYELFYAASFLANIVHSDQEKFDQCRVFIMVTAKLLSLKEKKEPVYSYNETVRMLSVVLRILSSKDIQDLSNQVQVLNIEKILDHHSEQKEKEEIPIYQETIKNFKIVLENLQAKKD